MRSPYTEVSLSAVDESSLRAMVKDQLATNLSFKASAYPTLRDTEKGPALKALLEKVGDDYLDYLLGKEGAQTGFRNVSIEAIKAVTGKRQEAERLFGVVTSSVDDSIDNFAITHPELRDGRKH